MQVTRLIPLLGVAVLATSGRPAVSAGDAPSSLAYWYDGRWETWWRSDRAPALWSEGPHVLATAVRWSIASQGVETAELRLRGSREAWRTRLIVVRLDPARVDVTLETRSGAGGLPSWRADRVDGDVLFAVNAGQFVRTSPWGWLVVDGVERLPAGVGPLSTAVAIMDDGAIEWMAGGRVEGRRAEVRFGFQSYPTLLQAGQVPGPLRAAGQGVDLAHRDARVAIGVQSDGRLLIAMTRFDGLGDQLGFIPLGVTTPEMAAIMGSLGAHHAVALDGGISGQMMVRDRGQARVWSGLRPVPLALVARSGAR